MAEIVCITCIDQICKGRNWLPDAGASISLALEGRLFGNRARFGSLMPALRRSRNWLPDAGASISLALWGRRQLPLPHPLRRRVRNAGVRDGKIRLPAAGASISLALEERWR